MRILWVINRPLPQVAKALGLKVELSQSWLLDLARAVKDSGNQLVSVCVDHVDDMKVAQIDGMNHYVMPFVSKFISAEVYKKYWKTIMEEEKPELIHLHGTEYRHPLPLLKMYPDVPSILTIQGVMTRIGENFYGGLSIREILLNRTMRENLHLGGMYFTKRQYLKQAKTEQEIVHLVDCVTGRTLWDYSVLKEINPNIIYYQCNYNLRENFYTASKWRLNAIEKYTIYTSFSSYPLKGLHMLLKAIAIVKHKFPDVKVIVPGVKGDEHGKIVVESGYTKYIRKLIASLNIEKNVRFVGGQTAEDVEKHLQKAHVCIVSSAIEGASATLREAMHIGTPCICSFRGGMTELLDDRINGFYYDYPEYPYLAERIVQLFDDDNMACTFSYRLIKRAEDMHNREKNAKRIIEIYNQILEK